MATEQLYLGGDRRSFRPWLVGWLLTLGTALIVLWLAWGGEETQPRSSASSQTRVESAEDAPSVTETSASEMPRGALETSELFAPKDPFDPVISTETAAGGRAASASKASSGATGEREVGLVAATARRGGSAEVTVNGTSYSVRRGETFANHFKLLAASGECVALLFGDQEFTLCEGDEILK